VTPHKSTDGPLRDRNRHQIPLYFLLYVHCKERKESQAPTLPSLFGLESRPTDQAEAGAFPVPLSSWASLREPKLLDEPIMKAKTP